MFTEIKAKREAGFSLIELLVVVLIIGILASIAIPSLLKQRDKAKNAGAIASARSALTAAKSYYTENGSYGGLTTTTLQAEEKTLVAGGSMAVAGDVTPGDAANPAKVLVLAPGNPGAAGPPVVAAVAASNYAVAANDTTSASQIISVCSVSKGDTIYCIKDDQAAGTTTFGKLKGTSGTAVTATQIGNIVYTDKF